MNRPQPKENASSDELLFSLTDVAEDMLNRIENYDGIADFEESDFAFAMYEIVMETLYGKTVWDFIDKTIEQKQKEANG